MEASFLERILITTPYFCTAVEFVALAGITILVIELVERWAIPRTLRGDFSLHVVVRNARYWRNAIVLYLLANSIASLAGGMGNIVLSYIGGFILLFAFFRTIDREIPLGELARGAVRTSEITLYTVLVLALTHTLLFPSL